MNWTIYYGDSTVARSDGCTVQNAPARDVQVIVQDHPEVGVEMILGSNYYIWRHKRWWGTDSFGLWDYLVEPGWKVVLFGRTMIRTEFDKIFRIAAKDKTGWLPRETRP